MVGQDLAPHVDQVVQTRGLAQLSSLLRRGTLRSNVEVYGLLGSTPARHQNPSMGSKDSGVAKEYSPNSWARDWTVLLS